MDREKVIKETKDGIAFAESRGFGGLANTMRDALALLKEPEAVKPKKVKGYNPPMYTIYEYECEKCQSPIMNKQPFCMGCGRSVKWDA